MIQLGSFHKFFRNKQLLEGEKEPVNEPLSFPSKEKIAACAPMLLDIKEPSQEHTLIKVPTDKGTETSELATNHKLCDSSLQKLGTCFAACTTGTVCMIQSSSAVSQLADTMLDLGAIHKQDKKSQNNFH